jgi:hypothetical protein
MPKDAAPKPRGRPRKALTETSSAVLNKKRAADDSTDAAPAKKTKKSIVTSNDELISLPSSATPPDFVDEITLPGEANVTPK